MIEGVNMLALIFKKMVRCFLGEGDENIVVNRKSMREINFLRPKLDYLKNVQEKMSA
jgi:hypothetical protein